MYNQTGFCKFRKKCINKHLEEICPESYCKDNVCSTIRRHPKDCKKYSDKKRCHFYEKCSYWHVKSMNETIKLQLVPLLCQTATKHQNEINILYEELQLFKVKDGTK